MLNSAVRANVKGQRQVPSGSAQEGPKTQGQLTWHPWILRG